MQLAVGQAMTIDFVGTFCYFRQSDTTQDLIEIRPDTQQGVLQLLPGQGFNFGSPVSRWIVKNIGVTNITVGQLVIADGDYRDQRVVGSMSVVGAVSLADAAKARVLANASFMAGELASSTTGQMARVVLWNPATNPNRLIVQSVAMFNNDMTSTTSAMLLSVGAPAGVQGGFGLSKKLNGTASAAWVSTDTVTGIAPSHGYQLSAGGAQQNRLQLADPIVVAPGAGLLLQTTMTAKSIWGSFEWYEEPNV